MFEFVRYLRHTCISFPTYLIILITSILTKKVIKDISYIWLNLEILENAFVFSLGDDFYKAVIQVGSTKDWVVFCPKEDQRICSQYDGCVIPFHRCLFLIGYPLPLNKFEVGAPVHLLIAPL